MSVTEADDTDVYVNDNNADAAHAEGARKAKDASHQDQNLSNEFLNIFRASIAQKKWGLAQSLTHYT